MTELKKPFEDFNEGLPSIKEILALSVNEAQSATPDPNAIFYDALNKQFSWRGRNLYLGTLAVGRYERHEAAQDDQCFVGFVIDNEKPVATTGSAADAKNAVEYAVVNAIMTTL